MGASSSIYKEEHLIGKGSFSSIYKSSFKNNNNEENNNNSEIEIAIKKIQINCFDGLNKLISTQNLLTTWKHLTQNSHSNIIQLISAYHDRKYCYFIMPYMIVNLSSLLIISRKLDEKVISSIILQIGSALNHMHSNLIIHTQVTLENIGIDRSGHVYLMNFRQSVLSDKNALPVIKGFSSRNILYLAPEALTTSHYYSSISDMWSLGVIAFELYFGFKPFPRGCPNPYIEYSKINFEAMWAGLYNMIMFNPNVIDPFDHHFDDTPNIQEPPCELIINMSRSRPSPEFISLLKGLLHCNPCKRLRTLLKYSQFETHVAFTRYGFNSTNAPNIPEELIIFLDLYSIDLNIPKDESPLPAYPLTDEMKVIISSISFPG